MENITCVLCDADNTEKVIDARDIRYRTTDESFSLVRCRNCGLVYVNPRPEKERIEGYYPQNYRTHNTIKSPEYIKSRMEKYRAPKRLALFRNPWYMDWPTGATVLDIGCGAGELLLRLKEIGCRAFGIDVDPQTSAALKGLKFEVITCDIDGGTPYEQAFFDVVVMRHSLEHVYNPVRVLKEVRRILKPDGFLVIGVPNIDSTVFRLTKQQWEDLDVPRHLFHFTPSTLTAILQKAGFGLKDISYEFKVSRKSLKRSFEKTVFRSLLAKPLLRLWGIILGLLHKGEWVVVRAHPV